jgi:type IV fimbrial biogenesis protein FimT
MRHRFAGFTIIELMVTIAIVAVLALVVAPSFVRMVANMRLQGAGNELVSDLHYARSEAVSRNRLMRLTTQADGRGYSIVGDPGSPDQYTLKQVELPGGITLTPGVTVDFSPLRGMTGTLNTLVLGTGTGTQLQLSANESGQVQLCSPNGSLSSIRSCAS